MIAKIRVITIEIAAAVMVIFSVLTRLGTVLEALQVLSYPNPIKN